MRRQFDIQVQVQQLIENAFSSIETSELTFYTLTKKVVKCESWIKIFALKFKKRPSVPFYLKLFLHIKM